MFKRIILSTALICMPFLSQADINKPNPYQRMTQAAEKTFVKLDADKAAIRSNPELLRGIVRNELLPYVQVKYAGALVLGRFFKEATPVQKETYFKAFEDYLVMSYAQALTLYNGEKYTISPERTITNESIIPIRITLSSEGRSPVRLDFQWRKNTQTNAWHAFDMAVEGVSMITTKQNEWATILRQNGIDELTKVLQNSAKQPIIFDK